MRRTALLVMLLLVAGCGGQHVAGERPGFPSLTPANVSAADDLPAAIFDQATRATLVLVDADLPAGLRHLVLSEPHRVTVGEPELFATGQWVLGRGEPYRPRALAVELPGLRESELGLASGTHVATSVADATALFRAGRSDARFADHVEATDLELGDEAVLLDVTTDDRHERQAVVRRANVLSVVTVSGPPSTELPGTAVVQRLAAVLDARVATAIAGELEPATATGLGTSPARQLDSFEFRFSSAYELPGGTTVVVSTGEFQAPDRQVCEIDLGDSILSLVGDSGGLAHQDRSGHRYLDDQASASIGPVCLGSSQFFDLTAEMFDESAYIAVAGGVASWTLETINGTETRHYSLDSASVAGLFGEQAPDRFDIWFDAADGWPVRLDYGGLFATERVLGPSVMSSRETVETTIRIDITRPNDPTIVVTVPDDILPAGSISS